MKTSTLIRRAMQEATERLVDQGLTKKAAKEIVDGLYKEKLDNAKEFEDIGSKLKIRKISGQAAFKQIVRIIFKNAMSVYRSEWKAEAAPIKAHMRDLRKRGYEFDMARVDRLTIRELKYYAKNPIEFNKRFGTPPSDTIPDVVTKTKKLSRRESWEKYKRDIDAYNKAAEKYHARKFHEFHKDEEGDYYIANWSWYSKRPRMALRNLPEKNKRAYENFVKVYEDMGKEGNQEAAYIARELRKFWKNDEVRFIQILNDAAAGENDIEKPMLFASGNLQRDNALQSFMPIYNEFIIMPYNSRTIED